MIYIVTGTPGSGKTTFARQFSVDNNVEYICGKEIVADNGLDTEFDSENDCYVVDEEKFAEICEEMISNVRKEGGSLIIDSHLSHEIGSSFVDTCFVTTCDISELKKRLEKRSYSSLKVRKNLDAEIFRVCEMEAKEMGHSVEVVDTSSKKK